MARFLILEYGLRQNFEINNVEKDIFWYKHTIRDLLRITRNANYLTPRPQDEDPNMNPLKVNSMIG
jgi:hypothetical protein